MDYVDLLSRRRSIRKFTEEQITREALEDILIAANGAPIGSNRYEDIHISVVQNRGALDKLSEAAAKRWQDKETMKKIIGNMKRLELSVETYDPFYSAPTVFFVSHRKQDVQPGIEFSNVACVTFSMHLATVNLGLGSVFMWFALESMREIPALDNTAVLNLPKDFEPLLGLAVGYPDNEISKRELTAYKMSMNFLR